MNGNEEIIIFLAIIGLPICLWALVKMPNASKCGSCGLPLNMHRQKTYHSVIENKNVEVCKTCYKNRIPFIPRKTKSQPIRLVSASGETNPISEAVEEAKTLNRHNMPQRSNSVSAFGESISISKAVEEVKPLTRSSTPTQAKPVGALGEIISIDEVLEEMKLDNCFWLDTETTGLSSSDEIIELSICTQDKRVVFDSIISSKVNCSAQARSVHGITDEQIAKGMPIESAKSALIELLEGKTIISFNVDFDCQMLFQSFGITAKKRFCVMKWSQSVLDYERWPRLEKVCERLNIKQPEAHRSLADTITTIDVFNTLVDLTSNHKSLLRDFALIDLNAIDQLGDEEALFLSPNSNIFAFDCLIDRYGNEIIGIRSKALKRMLKREGTRIFVKNGRKGKILKVQYIDKPDMQLPISLEELNHRLGALKLKKTNPNKYLSLKATVTQSSINKTTNEILDGTFYIPSIAINAKIYESLENLPIFHNSDRETIAFTIKTPKNTLKRLFALGLQGYSSILKVIEYDNQVIITAYHLLDAQKITILNTWSLDGEKAWSGDY
ncbi:3'-5' exonuclease [Vibrio parahaemolyticus]|nr:3'-5' exonuclease [Vibrio parahaemolyticus]MDF5009098.1 3'-5' exonuclease [Vibrio parahaemolyticus]